MLALGLWVSTDSAITVGNYDLKHFPSQLTLEAVISSLQPPASPHPRSAAGQVQRCREDHHVLPLGALNLVFPLCHHYITQDLALNLWQISPAFWAFQVCKMGWMHSQSVVFKRDEVLASFSRLHQASSGAVVGPSVYRAQTQSRLTHLFCTRQGFDFDLAKACWCLKESFAFVP